MRIKFLLGIVFLSLALAGCATTTRYTSYTGEKFPPKKKYYFVTVYFNNQKPPATQPYTVIGKVEISGHASDGVYLEMLVNKAKATARKKGADAIINATTEAARYNGTYVVPGHTSYRPVYFGPYERVYVGHYTPARYIPYSDAILRFRGDLVVFQNEFPRVQQK